MILSFTNRRGGAGKTASAHAIGNGLARSGRSVLFIDLDSQCNLTFDAGAAASVPGVFELLTGKASAEEATRHCGLADLIPGAEALAAADLTIKDRADTLKKALAPVRGKYDFIIIDTPPALGALTVNALAASDLFYITAQPEIHSFHGATMILNIAEAVRKHNNPELKLAGVILTRYKRREILARDMLANFEALASQHAAPVFIVPECNAIKEAQALQADIFGYSPRSTGAKAYADIVTALESSKTTKGGKRENKIHKK